MKLIRTEDAVGHVLCHDMTQIIKDQYKDARFRKGHIVTEDDIPVLLSMGKENLYVWEMTPGMVHENDAAERLLALCGQKNMVRSETKEGKIELRAACDGLFQVDSQRLIAVNSREDVMIATRKGNTAVKKGDKLAGMRVIPLIIKEETLQAAEQAAGVGPLLELLPYVKKTAAIVATGSEVKKGLIQDTFTPVVREKLAAPVGTKDPTLSAADNDLFQKLRQLRAAQAKHEGIPPYFIFSDATLRDMCRKKPQNLSEMRQVSGVGVIKAQKYGKMFLEELQQFLAGVQQ